MRKAEVIDVIDEQPPVRELTPIESRHFKMAESTRLQFVMTLPPGYRLADLEVPEVFGLIAADKARIHPSGLALSRVEVHSPAEGKWVEYLVVEFTDSYMRLQKLLEIDLPREFREDGLLPGYRVAYQGPSKQWCAIKDRRVMKDKFPTKTEALQWLILQTR